MVEHLPSIHKVLLPPQHHTHTLQQAQGGLTPLLLGFFICKMGTVVLIISHDDYDTSTWSRAGAQWLLAVQVTTKVLGTEAVGELGVLDACHWLPISVL